MCNEPSNTSGSRIPQPAPETPPPPPEAVPPNPAVTPAGPTPAIADERGLPREIASVGWGTPGETPRGLALSGHKKGRRLVRKDTGKPAATTAEQRLLILDTWQRSGLAGGEFGAIVGMSKHTLYAWKKRFDEHGPAGVPHASAWGMRHARYRAFSTGSCRATRQVHTTGGSL